MNTARGQELPDVFVSLASRLVAGLEVLGLLPMSGGCPATCVAPTGCARRPSMTRTRR